MPGASERTPRAAVFLDRDGVLNAARVVGDAAMSPRRIDDLHILDGVPEALDVLRRHGFLLIAVTNQPDIARGHISRTDVEAMHEHLRRWLPLDDIYVCPHDNEDGCGCRKPLDGLIRKAAEEHGVDLSRSWLVGDRWVDVAAGRSAGTRTVLVERDYSWRASSAGAPAADLTPTATALDLRVAAGIITGNRR